MSKNEVSSWTQALALCLPHGRKEGTGEGQQAFPGATLHCSLLFSSVVSLVVVHSFVEALAQEETFEKKKTRLFGIVFPYYIPILQNRNDFILIVYYSSTFVEARKKKKKMPL